MGVVQRLVTQRERITREAAAAVGEQLALFPESVLPAWARASVMNAVQRIAEPDTEGSIWPGGFCMLSRAQTAAVWDAIRALPREKRPNQVRHAFDLVLLNLRQDTGEVMLTCDQIAERMSRPGAPAVASRHVSEVMGTLERLGVIRRERRRVPGMKGPGMAVYFINEHVAWNGSLEIRKARAEEIAPPLLEIIEGGAKGRGDSAG